MAAEGKRGCGYRKVGGIYLVGGCGTITCDRIPYRLQECPVCGSGIHFARAMTEVNPLRLFGIHDSHENICRDNVRPCWLCDPEDTVAYIMMVGEKFYPTPRDFMDEAATQGISKRIPFIPKKFKLGETVIYLAHNRACTVTEPASAGDEIGKMALWEEALGDSGGGVTQRLVEAPKETKALGIFSAFVPQRIEKMYWQSEIDKMTLEEKEDLAKRGITPVGLPDGDNDHA